MVQGAVDQGVGYLGAGPAGQGLHQFEAQGNVANPW